MIKSYNKNTGDHSLRVETIHKDFDEFYDSVGYMFWFIKQNPNIHSSVSRLVDDFDWISESSIDMQKGFIRALCLVDSVYRFREQDESFDKAVSAVLDF